MTDFELVLQLFALLLGLSMAELLTGLARSLRIRAGATKAGADSIRIGRLVPLLGLLLLIDQTRFWITAYALRDHFTFQYASLVSVLALVGGYFTISTFVFPDDPAEWPDFDEYYLRINRIVVGGMLFVNLVTVLYAVSLIWGGVSWADVPIARSWASIGAALLYLPGLVALWFAKSPRTNLALLTFMNAVLLTVAFGPILF